MKKFLASALCITIAMSLAACSANQPEQTIGSSETTTQVTETTEVSTETTVETTTETTAEETTAAETTTETTETTVAAPKVVNLKEPKLEAAKDFKWSLKDGVLTLSGNGAMPDYKSEKKVPWYKSRKKITKVVFEGNITKIGAYSFNECTKLTSIDIPASVHVIGEFALIYTGLTEITVPDTVTYICDGAFAENEKLVSAKLSNNIAVINCFNGCSKLETVNIPEGVKIIEDLAFQDCRKLNNITLPNGLTKIGEAAFENCRSLTNITIPESVTSIGEMAFRGCSKMTELVIFGKVSKLGYDTFSGCSSLTSVTIHEGVTVIEDDAFEECTKLKTVTLPKSLKEIGQGAFAFCGMTSINIPDGVTEIGSEAFCACKSLTTVTGGAKVETISKGAFSECKKLTSFTITSSALKSVGKAFDGAKNLKKLNFPNATKLSKDSMKSAVKGSGVKTIKVKSWKK